MRRKWRQASRVFNKEEVNYGEDRGFRKMFRQDRRNFKKGQRDQRGKGDPKNSSFVEPIKPAS